MGRVKALSAVAFLATNVIACTDETPFTSEERELLEQFTIPVKPPPSPTNMYADDTRAAVLGKKFFFDPRFAGETLLPNDGISQGSLAPAGAMGKVSCADCHDLKNGGADTRSRPNNTSLGVTRGVHSSPTMINNAYAGDIALGGWQSWGGFKDSLWSINTVPPESTPEQNSSRLHVAHVIFANYKADYEAIFGTLPPLGDQVRFPLVGKPGTPSFDNMAAADQVAVTRVLANFGKAIEAYERRLISSSYETAPFDRMLAGDDTAMTPEAIRGAKLFVGKAGCNECHRGAALADGKFHNIGVPQGGPYVPLIDTGHFGALEFVITDPFNRSGAFSDHPDDSHIKNPVSTDADVGAFRTPTLRNIAKTGPYMHDGIYVSLWDVVNHYNFGGGTGSYSGTKEATIAPLLLTDREVGDLVEFLRSLSDGDPLPNADFPEGLCDTPALPNFTP